MTASTCTAVRSASAPMRPLTQIRATSPSSATMSPITPYAINPLDRRRNPRTQPDRAIGRRRHPWNSSRSPTAVGIGRTSGDSSVVNGREEERRLDEPLRIDATERVRPVRAPMDRHHGPGPDDADRLGGGGWIQVAAPTEHRAPAPDGDQRQIDRVGEVGHRREQVGVAGEVDRSTASKHEAERLCGRPERRSEPGMVCRDPFDADAADLRHLAGAHLANMVEARRPKPVARPGGRDDRDIAAEVTERRKVEVIPVHVGQQDDVDPGQAFALRDGDDAPERSDPRSRRRVGQHAHPVELDHGGGMPDEIDLDRPPRHRAISPAGTGRRRPVPRVGARVRSRGDVRRSRRIRRRSPSGTVRPCRHGSSRWPPGSSWTMARAASPPAKTWPSAATTCSADSSGDSAAAVRIAGSSEAGADWSGSISSRRPRSHRRRCRTVTWHRPQSRSYRTVTAARPPGPRRARTCRRLQPPTHRQVLRAASG